MLALLWIFHQRNEGFQTLTRIDFCLRLQIILLDPIFLLAPLQCLLRFFDFLGEGFRPRFCGGFCIGDGFFAIVAVPLNPNADVVAGLFHLQLHFLGGFDSLNLMTVYLLEQIQLVRAIFVAHVALLCQLRDILLHVRFRLHVPHHIRRHQLA